MALTEIIVSVGGSILTCASTTKYAIDKYDELTPIEKERIWVIIKNSPCSYMLERIAKCFIRYPEPIDIEIDALIRKAEEMASQAAENLADAKKAMEEAAQNLENTNKQITEATSAIQKDHSIHNPTLSPKSALIAARTLKFSQSKILKQKQRAVKEAKEALEEAEDTLWQIKHQGIGDIEAPTPQSMDRERIISLDNKVSFEEDSSEKMDEEKSTDSSSTSTSNYHSPHTPESHVPMKKEVSISTRLSKLTKEEKKDLIESMKKIYHTKTQGPAKQREIAETREYKLKDNKIKETHQEELIEEESGLGTERTISSNTNGPTAEEVERKKHLAEKTIYKMYEYAINSDNPWWKMSNRLLNLDEQKRIAKMEMERLEEQRLNDEYRTTHGTYYNYDGLIREESYSSSNHRSNIANEPFNLDEQKRIAKIEMERLEEQRLNDEYRTTYGTHYNYDGLIRGESYSSSNHRSNLANEPFNLDEQRRIAKMELERLEEQRLNDEYRTTHDTHYNYNGLINGASYSSSQPRSNNTNEEDLHNLGTPVATLHTTNLGTSSSDSEIVYPSVGEFAWGVMSDKFKDWWGHGNNNPDSPDGSPC